MEDEDEKSEKSPQSTVPKVVIARSNSNQSLPITPLHITPNLEKRRSSSIVPPELALIGFRRKTR